MAIKNVTGSRSSRSFPRRNSYNPLSSKDFPLTHFVFRIAVWYAIYIVLFRCPATSDSLTASDHALCKPYFTVREYVTPHVQPYYSKYAAHHVESLKPYYDQLDQRVLSPAGAAANTYLLPQVERASGVAGTVYQVYARPQIAKYEEWAHNQYEQSVQPAVRRGSDVVAPYVAIASDSARATYNEVLVPAYLALAPYAVSGYEVAADFTRETAVPNVKWASGKVFTFGKEAVWPHVEAVYEEHIEPQLAKIGQRLGKYGGRAAGLQKAKTTHAMSVRSDTKPSSFVKPPQQPSSKASTTKSQHTYETRRALTTTAPPSMATPNFANVDPIQAPDKDDNESDVRAKAREMVRDDLKEWQDRFTKAADEGAAEIDSLIRDITQEILTSPLMELGQELLKALEETVNTEIAHLKSELLKLIKKANQFTDVEAFKAEVATHVRAAGINIKAQAKDVRTWREDFDAQLHTAITNAADAHFKTLDTMRDLALQKIGMRWAWTDGITYKDWAKYHELKDRFDAWVDDLKAMIITHSGLMDTREVANAVEDRAMDLTRGAVKGLSDTREAAAVKWELLDEEDDWDVDSVKKRAADKAEALAQAELAAAVALVEAQEKAEREARLAALAEAEAKAAAEAAAAQAEKASSQEGAEDVGVGADEVIEADEPVFVTQVDPPVPTGEVKKQDIAKDEL